jgi:hypothetical protein
MRSRKLTLSLILIALCGAATAAAAPKSVRVSEPREGTFRSRTSDYRVILSVYGHLLQAHIDGRMVCIGSDGARHYKRFRLHFDKSLLGVGGLTGRFSYTDRPLARGTTLYGVDEALRGNFGPPRVLPGSFEGAFEYVVRRPWIKCWTGKSPTFAEVPFQVERISSSLRSAFSV